MHPSLHASVRLLPPGSVELPEAISDNVEFCLRMKLADLTSVRQFQEALDSVGDAQAEVNEVRAQVGYIRSQVQAQMRLCERQLRADNPKTKPTEMERVLKTDEAHIALEAQLAQLVSLTDYCTQVLTLLESKAFSLRVAWKDKHGG